MADNVTLLQLRTRTRQLANVENDVLVTDAEVNALINLHAPDVYDLLVEAGPSDYYSSTYILSVTAGVTTYALPADFMQLVNVFVQESNVYNRPIDPMQDRMAQAFQPPVQSCSLMLEYVPRCPTLVNDSDTFDGVDGWDNLISAKSARDILIKREGDASLVMAIIASEEKRIRSLSTSRKRGGPKFFVDFDADQGWPRAVQIDAFRLRAQNIEVFSSLWGPFG